VTLNNYPSWRDNDPDDPHNFSSEIDMASAEELSGPLTFSRVRAERLRQAKWTFNAALFLVVFGVSIVLVGVSLMLYMTLYRGGSIASGAIMTAAGVVNTILSSVLFHLNSEANNRLDSNDAELSALERARMSMLLTERIEDSAKRDDARRKLTERIPLEVLSGRSKVKARK